jgi:uncharacterized membrane protein YfcA
MLLGGAELDLYLTTTLILIGLLAGVLGGLLGVGGGLVMIPAMLIVLGDHYGPGSMHEYKLAALGAACVLSIRAARRHAQAGAIAFTLVPAITVGAVAGVAVGTALAGLFADEHTHVLRRLFGGFMLLVVASSLWRERLDHGAGPRRTSCPGPACRWQYACWVGLPSGVISGFLGIGGGVWAVPMQHFSFGVRLQNAIANSSCMIVAVAAAAAAAQSVAVGRMPGLAVADGWILAAVLAPGALLGGGIGAALTHKINTRWLHQAFHILLTLAGLRLLLA